MDDNFSWKKFFVGFFEPKNFAKAIVQTFHICLLLLIVFAFYSLAVKLKGKVKQIPPVTINGMQGGEVHNSSDDVKKKVGLINLF